MGNIFINNVVNTSGLMTLPHLLLLKGQCKNSLSLFADYFARNSGVANVQTVNVSYVDTDQELGVVSKIQKAFASCLGIVSVVVLNFTSVGSSKIITNLQFLLGKPTGNKLIVIGTTTEYKIIKQKVIPALFYGAYSYHLKELDIPVTKSFGLTDERLE